MEDKLEKIGFFKALKPFLNQSCLTSKGTYNLIRFFKQCTTLTKLADIIKGRVGSTACSGGCLCLQSARSLCHDSSFFFSFFFWGTFQPSTSTAAAGMTAFPGRLGFSVLGFTPFLAHGPGQRSQRRRCGGSTG